MKYILLSFSDHMALRKKHHFIRQYTKDYQIFLIKTQFSFEANSFGHFPNTIPIYFSIIWEQFFDFFFFIRNLQCHILLEVSGFHSPTLPSATLPGSVVAEWHRLTKKTERSRSRSWREKMQYW